MSTDKGTSPSEVAMDDEDVHVLAVRHAEGDADRRDFIRDHLERRGGSAGGRSALLRAQDEGSARVYGILGGQGNNKNYFDEFRTLYNTYRPLVQDVVESAAQLLNALSRDERVSDQYESSLDVTAWLQGAAATPSADYLVTAPVSFPLIGLLQLAQIKVVCVCLGCSPAELPAVFRGLAGHSQGVIVATAVATASTWAEFHSAARKAVEILFWIGARCQQSFAETPLPLEKAQQLESEGYGAPTPMLSARNISRRQLDRAVAKVNAHLPPDSHMAVSLANSPSGFVVSGTQRSLAALVDVLKGMSAKDAQSRVPFSRRKPNPSLRFLPISIPCHCPLLSGAAAVIEDDVRHIQIAPQSLRIPVNRDADGLDISSFLADDVVPTLIRLITSDPVDWLSVDFAGATHIIDFGPGGTGGVGALTQRNTAGSGTRVILPSLLDVSRDSDLGAAPELFGRAPENIRRGPHWGRDNSASLVDTAAGTMLDTKLSRLLGLPPFFVAGMTPTTTHPEFCAAVMAAGYHVEFAAGGYHSAGSLRAALYRLRDLMPAGRSITINVIYINPRAIAWQIPLIRDLRAEGFPIGGLTVGGGVPSVEVATEYITALGLDHISFKPGSVGAIRSVAEIARRNPSFPVILQWTGGRGGGHHSCEDFHAPILETYAEVRRCDNIVLVAGSGFGAADDVLPYLNGEWSLARGAKSPMPFDGFLFGSRVMACLEAKTSPGAKAAITAAPGVASEAEWEGTYAGPAGGILTVISEMGEDIHIVATRGGMFWAEMDRLVFKLEKSKRAAVLEAKRDYIIRRLGVDFQKPWFGTDGADLRDMTYLQVLKRTTELMRFLTQSGERKWIDPSYAGFFHEFVLRTQERLGGEESPVSEQSAREAPESVVTWIADTLSDAADTQLCTEDVHFFLQLCRRPGCKPVPFVPALDENFETYFKKDSLWQSEQVEAVVGQDADRTFILHGPVATRAIQRVDEPVKEVLDGINDGVIKQMSSTGTGRSPVLVRQAEFLHNATPRRPDQSVGKLDSGIIDIKSTSEEHLRYMLAGKDASWRSALFGSSTVHRGCNRVPNPVWTLVRASGADTMELVEGRSDTQISFYQQRETTSRELVLEITKKSSDITVSPFTSLTPGGDLVPLVLKYRYSPETPYAPIRETEHDRNERIYTMYRKLWLSDAHASCSGGGSPETNVFDETFVIDRARVQAFNRAVGYHKSHRGERVPLDFSIVAAWKSVSRALLQDPVQGDLLALVHLSNSYEVAKGARPLEVGETIQARSHVSSITIDDSGKTVEVLCHLTRAGSGERAVSVRSRFLFRGAYRDFESTFTRTTTPERFDLHLAAEHDLAVLESKPWFKFRGPESVPPPLDELCGSTLEFHLDSLVRYESRHTLRSAEISGKVYKRGAFGQLEHIGTVSHQETSPCEMDAVRSYLRRAGRPTDDGKRLLDGDAPPSPAHVATITIPTSNEPYSRASGDVNPIHTSPMFAALVDLPGTITHGMYCSAAVRAALERTVAAQHPERIAAYDVRFVGMVLPGDQLDAAFTHTAMRDGQMEVQIDVTNQRGEKVLAGEARVAQPRTTILFTGQGSQEKGMGMDLYETSAVARDVWDRADAYFRAQFGLSILDIVRRNPRSVTVHFGGARGRALRKNYMGMFYEQPSGRDGGLVRMPIFPSVGGTTRSFTHSSPAGLLFTTQFAQPALAIMELAAFRDMQAAGVVDRDCSFAGHSLGEYMALAANCNLMAFETLMYIVFCRGMTMQLAVERDEQGRSDYGMVAVDPGRAGKGTLNSQDINHPQPIPKQYDSLSRWKKKEGGFASCKKKNKTNKACKYRLQRVFPARSRGRHQHHSRLLHRDREPQRPQHAVRVRGRSPRAGIAADGHRRRQRRRQRRSNSGAGGRARRALRRQEGLGHPPGARARHRPAAGRGRAVPQRAAAAAHGGLPARAARQLRAEPHAARPAGGQVHP